ncbi:shikimate dehydrogenase [Actinotalea subterranea]|uniref:shikimate dehydrogenase n=1 Tax=Actinotalea subterranea TaxID=2607497 RepID=UPI0011EECE58|nr:shikimate dehydrogenase [Actinotalea subterranea]
MSGRRAAVLGHPVAHSLSPALHRAAYTALGLGEWRYDAIDVTQDDLEAFVAGLDEGWAGLSLTMPLKQAVLPLLDHVEPLAEVVGAVNTLLVQGGGRRPTLVGVNTDVHGIVAALREGLATSRARHAVVLGAGATAASTLAALAQLGCATPDVFVRSMARAGATMRAAHRMGVEPRFLTMSPAQRMTDAIRRADVVVSTLPPHAADEIAAALGQAPVSEPVTATLLDCAYDPRPTALGAAWTALGGVLVPGERMLLHQATEQVRLMTGRPAPLAAMESALGAALG